MKICPQCRAQFQDDMNFCLQDGSPLAQAENPDEKTLNLPSQANLPPTVAETRGYFEGNNQTTGAQINQPTFELNNAPTGAHKAEAVDPYSMHKAAARNSRSPVGILVGVLIGGLLLLGTAVGGVFWFLKNDQNRDVAMVRNTNSTNQNQALPANNDVNLDFNSAPDANSELPTNLKSNSIANTRTSNLNSANALKPTPTRETIKEPQLITDDPDYPEQTPTQTRPTTPSSKTVPKVVSGGVVNGKAVNLVKPAYPAAARAVRASGAVNVQVTIDEDGNVVSASAVSGHPLLRPSAVQAARASKFSPTVLSGQPVKVTGVIVYNFVP